MRLPSNLLHRLLLLAFLLPWAAGAPAQERNDHGGAAPAMVTTQQLVDLRAALRAGLERVMPMVDAIDTTPAEDWLEASPVERISERLEATAADAPERSIWQAALENEQAGIERIRGALERAGLALAAEQRLGDAERRIRDILDARLVAPDEDDRSLTRIEQEIASLETRRTQLSLERDQKRQTLERLEAQARTQQETLQRLRRERTTDLDTTPWGPLDEPTLADAFTAWEHAQERRADARIITAQLDAETIDPRTETLRLELQVLETKSLWLGQRQRQLASELIERAGEELRSLRAEVRNLVEREPDAAERFGPQIQLMLQRIDRIAETQARVRDLQESRELYAQIENDLSLTLASVRERLEIGGLTDVLGGLLVEEERRLRRLVDLQYVLRDLERELAQSRLRDITLRDELRTLPADPPVVMDDRARAELQRLQRQVIETQLHADEQLTEQLHLVEARLRTVVLQVEELSQILRESLLWWPSHPPVGIDWATRLPSAVVAFLDPASWQELRNALYEVTIGSPFGALLSMLAAALLVMWGRGTPGHLARLAEMTTHRFTDRIGLTFQAIGWSLLRVIPIPVLLAATGFRLERIPDIGPGVEMLALVLFSVALWWVAGHIFLLFTSRNGVGMAHLDWNPLVVRRLRRHLAWYLPVLLLLVVFLALTFGHPNELVHDVFARAGLAGAAFVSGLFAWRMLAPRRESEATERQERRRRLLRIALTGFAAVLIGLTLAGYLLTVATLLGRTINTLIVVAAVWLGYNLAERALVLSETRLMIRRMREQRVKAAAIEAGSTVGEGAVIDMPEPHLSVENINQQTRTLLRVTAGAAMVLGLFWVWADILPALTWLDGVTLWSRTIAVGDTEILSRVSLQDFLLAIFLGVLFTLAARNLPGLVEILLSRSTQMDAAGRYTVTTLLRYVLAVVAVISVFSLLGLRWSELQWMVAALTLGLGFGLQEVVANFVSGIIMLFERPVRVGDTITIGEYSGTVSRIRTRATTIVDWDNREIVIPNKNFITERLINWTLSDTMTRIVLPVGVSYDADVDEVMKTLREIAEASPLVLKEPPPNVLFLKFGDSALSFELRIYVNQMKDRLVTISALHQTIIKEFRRKGIEIAYPQMDLHIRDVAPGAGAASSPAPSPDRTDPRPAN
ncbi:mechanosensitive ion channel domain-containing protein [Thioalkalivibrio sp.]|uniref:mechanosensitive ion channel domain-containing protein n=1 Tax=Thioalkalivibrio sp. TaxID=2093813 RepID=UPI0012D4CB9F|nr:mechanosensitive ion channel domain-containing protein [Thioalkalivibrio sp.]TVP81375.1 MAG: mechanosensitive ion channel protein MscS [Thioalkalivibrio sp.]